MTDAFEDRLRHHLADRAASVEVEPDPTAVMERAAGRSRPKGLVAGGVAALGLLVAGAGILTGVNLAGAGSTAEPAASTTAPGRAGAELAPGAGPSSEAPSIVVQTPYALLFTRVGSSGVTIRAYSTGTPAGGCTSGSCTSSTTVPGTPSTTVPGTRPCPTGVMCAEPILTPHASAGASGGAAGSGGTTVTPGPPVTPPAQTGGSGTGGSAPPVSTPSCGQLVVELSTDRAVGTGSVLLPATAPSAANSLQILGSGSFGSAEGAPVSWVAVGVGSGMPSVQLTVNGTPVDAMAPQGGVVVLALPGGSGLAGASVVGLDQGGATVSAIPATQGIQPAGADGCPVSPVTPTTSTTAVSEPPTTSTTVPVDPTPTPTPTPTPSPPGTGAPVPGPDLPVAPQRG